MMGNGNFVPAGDRREQKECRVVENGKTLNTQKQVRQHTWISKILLPFFEQTNLHCGDVTFVVLFFCWNLREKRNNDLSQ